jgi:hypothetical protein
MNAENFKKVLDSMKTSPEQLKQVIADLESEVAGLSQEKSRLYQVYAYRSEPNSKANWLKAAAALRDVKTTIRVLKERA